MTILADDPRWAGRLRRNELSELTEIDGHPLRDEEVIRAASWLEQVYGTEWPLEKIRNAMIGVADRNRYHPIREELRVLPSWDSQPRIHRLLRTYLGVGGVDGDPLHELHEAYGRCFLISMVARVMKPGEKVDTVLALQGPQGYFKSTAFKVLAGEAYFSDDKLPFDDPKRLGMALRGKWIIEFAEFASVKRADVDEVKRFLSQASDRYVPMYGRSEVVQPRTCVFVATVNAPEFLLDAGRRWWVAQVVRHIDIALLRRDRDQLLAEALYRYQAGERWWLPPQLEERQAEETRRYGVSDFLTDAIIEWWGERADPFVTWDQIVEGLVTQGAVARGSYDVIAKVTMTEQKAMGKALRDLGWRSHDRGGRHKPRKVWIPPIRSQNIHP